MGHLQPTAVDTTLNEWIKVEAQWLSGRMPDSRTREHRYESPTHWRRWWRLVVALLRHDITKSLYLYFAINRDLFIIILSHFLLMGNLLGRIKCIVFGHFARSQCMHSSIWQTIVLTNRTHPHTSSFQSSSHSIYFTFYYVWSVLTLRIGNLYLRIFWWV